MSIETQNDPRNEAEITYWNSAGGRRRVERQQSQDVTLALILQATLERAQVRQGGRVVDIGCGTGASSIALAERVGPSGQVLGVDVSVPMLALAAEHIGVMFFAEPARAFANLRTALKPSGRLALAYWRISTERLPISISPASRDAKLLESV